MIIGNSLAQTSMECYNSHWGYIFGTSGQMWTKEKQDALSAKAGNTNYELSIKYGSKWIGHYVADCSGLIVYICKQNGLTGIPHGSNSIWKNSLTTRGEMTASLPVGALVFKCRNGNDMYHVGIFVGNGEVIEAQGTKSGVVKSNVSAWSHFGLLKGVNYSGDEEPDMQTGLYVVDVPNDGTLNVRAEPSKTAKVSGTVREGETVEVLSIQGEWAEVRYKTGFCMKKYLKGKN